MNYTITRKVGSGAFGTVYEAHDDAGRRYAAKVVSAADPVALELIKGQYELLAALDHRRIVAAVDLDLDAARGPVLLAEFADGVDLKTHVETCGAGRLPDLALKVLDALRHLEARGRLHGDLKPDSILVGDGPAGPDIKLVDAGLDFGQASRLPAVAGTLPYLAPEIVRNLPADGRSDLYSLGVTIYEALTGVSPFAGPSAEAILMRHLEHVPPPPSTLKPGVAPAWDVFLAGLLKPEPSVRYQDAGQAASELVRLFAPQGASLASLAPASSTGLTGLEAEARRVRDFVVGRPVAGQLVCLVIEGAPGSGVERLTGAAEVAGKAAGEGVLHLCLNGQLPALAQVVEALRTGAPGAPAAADVMQYAPTEAAADGSAAYGEIISGLKRRRGGGRRQLVIIDGAEALDAAELATLELAATLAGEGVRLVLGLESAAGASRAIARVPSAGEAAHGAAHLRVPPLDRAGLESILKRHFGVLALPDGLADHLDEASRGDRRALDIVLAQMWASGALVYSVEAGRLVLVWDRSARPPATVLEALADQLGRLSPAAREAVGLVCASGGRLALEAIRRFFSPQDCSRALAEAVEGGLVEEAEARTILRVRLDAVADVALAAMPAGWLAGASPRLASILESGLAREADRYGLGLLYLRAGNPVKAYETLVEAGDRLAQFSPVDAAKAYAKALECAPGDAASALVNEKIGDVRLARGDLVGACAAFECGEAGRPSCRRKLGWVHGLRGDVSGAVKMLASCEAAASASGDLAERARVLSDLGYLHSVAGSCDQALDALVDARLFFDSRGFGFEAGLAANRLGIAAMRSGDIAAAIVAWEEARVHFERAGARRHVGMAVMALGVGHWKQLDFARALGLFEAAGELFEATHSLSGKSACCQNRGLVFVDTGDVGAARRLALEALQLSTLLGDNPSVTAARLLLALAELEAGNAAEAERHLAALPLKALSTYYASVAKRYLSIAQALRGNYEDALALAGQSRNLAVQAADSDGEGRADLAAAEILVDAGRPADAVEPAARALDTFKASALTLLAAIAERVLGEALCLTGRMGEGATRLAQAQMQLRAVGDSLHLGRVHRALAAAGCAGADFNAFEGHFRLASDIFRARDARLDYARTLLVGGRAASLRGNIIKAKNYLAEAGRILSTLGAAGLGRQVAEEMKRMIPDETEAKAVTSLSRISQTLNSSWDLTTVLNLAMDLAMEYLGAERGVLMLEDEATGRPTTIVERKMDKESVDEVITISRSIVDTVRRTGQPVVASDATADPRFMNSKSVRIHNVMSVMCVPLVRKQHLVGLIYLDNRDVPSDFSALERAFIDAFANQVALAIENARDAGRLYDDVADLKARAGKKYSFANIIGPGKEMQEVFRQVEKAAPSSISVLLTGESGTGKELVAGLLHELSPRRDKPLVRLNCAAIHRDLIEAELFGIEKHVATGVAPRSGFFERADGGTLFLDEIGDMPLTTQTRVLRVLAEREFERVGGSRLVKVDVRVISATNQDVKDLIARGMFRQDLYFRLNAMRIHLPPLRERLGDLVVLAEHFLAKYAAENSRPPMRFSPAALSLLARYTWPGNVRELERCIEHAVVVTDVAVIGPEDFPRDILDAVAEDGVPGAVRRRIGHLPEMLRELEREAIVEALKESGGVKVIAARRLGIHESTLRKKIKELGIDLPAE